MPAVWIEHEQFVVHSPPGRDLTVRSTEFVNERIGIDVIECEARGNVGRFFIKYRSDIGVFPIKIQNVSREVSLLKHVACPSQIVDPRTRLFRPGLIAVEPLSEGAERSPRSFINQRLVR